MLSLRKSKKDKIAGTESKRGVGGEAVAETAKGQITEDSLVNSEDFGLGWEGKSLGSLSRDSL